MFDEGLCGGAVCDGVETAGHRPLRFRAGTSTWYVTRVEAMWREWSIGETAGSDLELWRVHAAATGGGSDVIAVLARDLLTGRWRVHTVWD